MAPAAIPAAGAAASSAAAAQTALLVATAAVTAASAASQFQQAKTAAKQSKLNAAAEARNQRRKSAREMSKTRAAFGASGVQLAGTPLLVLQDQAAEADIDRRMILHGGRLSAAKSKRQGNAALLKGAGSILGSASSSGVFSGGG